MQESSQTTVDCRKATSWRQHHKSSGEEKVKGWCEIGACTFQLLNDDVSSSQKLKDFLKVQSSTFIFVWYARGEEHKGFWSFGISLFRAKRRIFVFFKLKIANCVIYTYLQEWVVTFFFFFHRGLWQFFLSGLWQFFFPCGLWQIFFPSNLCDIFFPNTP